MVVRSNRRSIRSEEPESSNVRVALVELDSDVVSQLADPLAGFDTYAYADLEELKASQVHLLGPLVVVLGPSQAQRAGIEEAGKLVASRAGLGAVLVPARLSTDVLRAALRAGIDDAIALGSITSELAPIVREVGARAAADALSSPPPALDIPDVPGRGRVTTVFSPKGGVGTSVVAVNLAASLAQKSPRPVVLVDLDLQFGDVAVMLRMPPNSNIVDVARAGRRADATMVRSLLTADEGTKTLVLPAPPEPTLATEVDASTVSTLFAALREMGAHVVVDTPTGLNDLVLHVLSESDDVVYVLGMDIPSVKNARLGLQAFELLEIPLDRVLVVLNRANSKVNLAPRDVERTLEMKIDVSLPSEAAVPQSVNTGSPVVVSSRKARFAAAIEQLAEKIKARAVSGDG